MYACKKATNNSKHDINSVIGTDKPDQARLPLTKIIPTKDTTIICPAVMFANKRINNAAGLINIPANSIGIRMGYKATGTPGWEKICFQNPFFENSICTINVNNAKTIVKEIFPVRFGLLMKGISPNKLPNQIKKNTVNR